MRSYRETLAPVLIENLAQTLRITLKLNGFGEEAQDIATVISEHSNDPGRLIQLEGPWEGEYAYANELQTRIDAIVFAIAEDDFQTPVAPRAYGDLLRLLRGLENGLTKLAEAPKDETEFHQFVEAVLACRFAELQTKPAISTPLKNFEPDTGVPEATTLIEYKYLRKRSEVARAVDQIFADVAGYSSREWKRIVIVVYETGRFATLASWRKQLATAPNTEVVLVRGQSLAAPHRKRRPTR
ncbi:MAG: hypothetical protein R3E12_09205 [Candidatus Eisenbacteria bacterium]